MRGEQQVLDGSRAVLQEIAQLARMSRAEIAAHRDADRRMRQHPAVA